MAPFSDFPTFKTRKDYVITEAVEPFVIVAAIVVLCLALAVLIAFYCCVKCVCRQRRVHQRDYRVSVPLCPCSCDRLRSHLHFLLQQVLSSVFDVIEVAEDEGRSIILFAKRRRPRNNCCYVMVLAYFTALFILLSFLFLSLFSNFLIYRKTSNCNDINVKTQYSICFDLNNNYEVVNCLQRQNDSDLEVICYLTDFNIFRALGTAFGAIQAFRTLISIIFALGIKLGLKWPCWTTTLQVFGALVIVVLCTTLYSLFYTHHISIILYGDPPLVHATLLLALATIFVFVCLHPWRAFKESTIFEKRIRGQEDNVNYLVDVETSTAGNNMEQPLPPGQAATNTINTPLLPNNLWASRTIESVC